jgi:hypothetical protein
MVLSLSDTIDSQLVEEKDFKKDNSEYLVVT